MPDFSISPTYRADTYPRFAIGDQTGSLYLIPARDKMPIVVVGKGGMQGCEGMHQALDFSDRILPAGTTIVITA